MGLNSRKAQIFWAVIPFVTAGLALELPFIWRALKTKKSGDIKVAAAYGVLQIAVYIAFAFDPSNSAKEVSNITGATVWFCAFAAIVGAAYLYRPLSKEEAMDQARNEQPPGSSYLG